MYQFNYHRPASLDEAASLMAGADDGTYLSGGMTLIPTLKQRLAAPSDVIDLGGIGALSGITDNGNTISVGAMTRHAEVAASNAIPALAALAGQIGDAHVRNRGTIGGSIANSDPAADYPAAVVALDSTIHTTKRSIPGGEFFKGLFETALDEGEIITSVEFTKPTSAVYAKFPNPASRYAVVGVFVARCGDATCVGVTGAGPCAFRWSELEAELASGFSASAVANAALDHSEFNADIHASAEFRGNLVRVMAERAIASLI